MVMILESSHTMLWLVSHMCSAKVDFELLELETSLSCSFRRVQNWRFVWPRYTFSQSPHGIEYTACVFRLLGTRSLGFATICLNVRKGFRATWMPQLFCSALPDCFRNSLNVRDCCKTFHSGITLWRVSISQGWTPQTITEKALRIIVFF